MKFDELNKLFSSYFSKMEIPKEDRKKRVDCALFFYEILWYLFVMIKSDTEKNTLESQDFYISALRYRIEDEIEATEYVERMTQEVVETTFRHLNEEYFLSEDRAILISQNEANSVMNQQDFISAKRDGKKYKTWITEGDERVRDAHVLVDYTKIPIDEYFHVGDDLMLYPHDYLNGSAENLVNCRCSCKYE